MKLERVSHIPYIQRVGRYRDQMLQAKYTTPVTPISSYDQKPLFTRQQQWEEQLSDSLARLYRYTADLDQAAREMGSALREHAITPDTEQVLHHTRMLVNRYNRWQLFRREKEDALATHKLDRFEGVVRAAEGVLTQFGIRLLPNGQLELDDEKWLEAVETGYTDFEEAMHKVARRFQEETIQMQSKPLGSFSIPFEQAESANPYSSSLPSSLLYRHAVSKGLYLNTLW